MKSIWRNEIVTHLLVSGIFFGFLSVAGAIGNLSSLSHLREAEVLGRFGGVWGLAALWVGALVGTYLLDIDHLLYWFVNHPEAEDSIRAKEIISRFQETGRQSIANSPLTLGTKLLKTAKELYQLLNEVHGGHTRLTFHTAIFQGILLVLALFVASSSGNWFGIGLVLALNLHLLKDEWQDYFGKGKEALAKWLFWQIPGTRLPKNTLYYLVGVSLVFLVITRMVF